MYPKRPQEHLRVCCVVPAASLGHAALKAAHLTSQGRTQYFYFFVFQSATRICRNIRFCLGLLPFWGSHLPLHWILTGSWTPPCFLYILYNPWQVLEAGKVGWMLERPFYVRENSYVFLLHVGCSSLKVHTFQKFPSRGKFLPERQGAKRKISF